MPIFINLFTVIQQTYGNDSSLIINALYNSWSVNNVFAVMQNPTVPEQIRISNMFWEHVILPFNDTADIKIHLVDGTELELYQNTFQSQWLPLLKSKNII
jgi:hypothetical protein